jgi:hypothetical protein
VQSQGWSSSRSHGSRGEVAAAAHPTQLWVSSQISPVEVEAVEAVAVQTWEVAAEAVAVVEAVVEVEVEVEALHFQQARVMLFGLGTFYHV